MRRLRLGALALFFLLGFVLVSIRAFQLQILPSGQVMRLARRQLQHRVEIVGRRGIITDRNGRELAVSADSLSVFANPQILSKNPEDVRLLAQALGRPEKQLQTKLAEAGSRRFIWLARQLSAEQMARLEKVDLKEIQGAGTVPEFRREFPLGPLAGQTLGMVSVDGQGQEGLERLFDEQLKGARGEVVLSRDALGRPVYSKREQIRADESQGARLELTLDANLQYSAEQALKEAVEKHQADAGTAIVLDPNNGEILALANFPSFDPNSGGDAPLAHRRNRAIADPIEPGSVLKPFVVARALEDKIVRPETMIDTHGGFFKIGNKTINEADAKHRFAKLSVVDVIRLSSNVGTVVLKNLMGFDRIADTYKKLGFGSTTGIELGGESRGIFNIPRSEQQLEQATIAFGQGISLTPLQIARAYAVLANGGTTIQPHLWRKIGSQNWTPVPHTGTRVYSAATAQKMRSILEMVVENEGTGVMAKVEGFKVAGKTGTAQRVRFGHGGYERGAYWASFAGFIPSESPRFVIYVMVDRPRAQGYYGAQVAAPVFARIAQAAVRLVPTGLPTPKMVASQNLPRLPTPKKILALKKRVALAGQMPDLTGLPLSYAMRELKQLGLRLEVEGEGDRVAEQLPVPGTKTQSDTTVYLKLR